LNLTGGDHPGTRQQRRQPEQRRRQDRPERRREPQRQGSSRSELADRTRGS
jgi:hypothetical protein